MTLRGNAVTILAILLMGCQAGAPTSVWVLKSGDPSRTVGASRSEALIGVAPATSTLTVELDWLDAAFNLLTTTTRPARVVAQLFRVTGTETQLIGQQEQLRADFVNGKPVFRFAGVTVGTYELRFSAYDDAGLLTAENVVRVSMEAGKTQQVRTQLKRVSPRVATSASPAAPLSQSGGMPSVPVLASELPATPPPPLWTPAPTPMPSGVGNFAPQGSPAVVITPVPSGSVRPAPTPTPPPSSAPAPLPAGSLAPSLGPIPSAAMGADLPNLLAEGETRDLLSSVHTTRFNSMLEAWGSGSRQTLANLINLCQSRTEAILILKALAASEPWENVTAFAAEIRGLSDAFLIAKTTMRDDPDLTQQWQDACGPSLVLSAVGEQDPRYAWELNKLYVVNKVDPFGANKNLADLQKTWLEEYGGLAVPRGATGGRGIGILYLLNDKLSPITAATYTVQDTSNMEESLDGIEQSLKQGYDVPLRLIWNKPGEGAEQAHFMLASAIRGQRPNREFRIHDSYTGRTAWVSETTIQQDSVAPLYQVYAHLTHYYRPTPKM